MFAARINADRFEHLHAAIRRAGLETILPDHQGAGAADVEAVDILQGRNRLDHEVGVDMGRQGQLHQDAVDRWILVQRCDPRQQFGLAEVSRVFLQHRFQPGVFAGLDLVAHIDLAGRTVANQQHGQTRLDAAGSQSDHPLSNFRPDFL